MKSEEVPIKSKRGGARKGSGRKKGRPIGSKNVVPMHVREAARVYADMALEELARLVKRAKPDSTRVMAINSILDRAWGKARQMLEHSGPGGGPIQTQHTVDLSKLTNEQLDQYEAIVRAASISGGNPGGEDPTGIAD